MAQNCARSVPESLRVNPTNKGAPVGSYFLYSEAGWSDVFGVLTHSGTYEVKQCRDGTQVWSGQVIVWLGTRTNKVPAHGRRDPYSSASVFQTGDDLVPISGSCLQQTPAPVPTPEDSPPPTPAPEDADSVETALGGDGASCALGSDCTGGKFIWFKCTSGKNGQKMHHQ